MHNKLQIEVMLYAAGHALTIREKQIMYYADKRVKHTEIVDLAERFRDGRQRHGRFDTQEDRALYEQVEKRTYELEQRLFAGIDLKPEDIK